jgi:hypothetical protein
MSYDLYNDNGGKEHLEQLIREAAEERRAQDYLKSHPEEKTSTKVRQILVKLVSNVVR